MTTSVYLVWHTSDGSAENELLIGVYSCERLAVARIERARMLPGLAEYPNEFRIASQPLDYYEHAYVDA